MAKCLRKIQLRRRSYRKYLVLLFLLTTCYFYLWTNNRYVSNGLTNEKEVGLTKCFRNFSKNLCKTVRKGKTYWVVKSLNSLQKNYTNDISFTTNRNDSNMELSEETVKVRNSHRLRSPDRPNSTTRITGVQRDIPSVHDPRLIPLQDFGTNVLLFSAILGNTSSTNSWDRLAIQGWENRIFDEENYTCCVRYSSGGVFKYLMIEKNKRNFNVSWRATQFICNTNGNSVRGEPVYATLVPFTKTTGCPSDMSMYLKIVYAYGCSNCIAAFEKIIYDNASATDLLAWFEIHRAMGLGKSFIYTFRLNSNASRVLEYYQELGLAEVIPFAFPTKDYYTKSVHSRLHTFDHYNHEDVTILDVHERVRGYKYMVSLDIDEYLIPTKNESWQTLFDRMFEEHPNSAGFYTDTYIYITDWGPIDTSSAFTVGRFLKRTHLTQDRHKHVIIPSRVRTTQTHKINRKEGFSRFRLPEKEGGIRHYRKYSGICTNINDTCQSFNQHMDTRLADFFKYIENLVLDIKRKLQI